MSKIDEIRKVVKNAELMAKLEIWHTLLRSEQILSTHEEKLERLRLEKKLGMPIKITDYRFLVYMRDNLKLGKEMDFVEMGVQAGYRELEAKKLGIRLLYNIPDQLFHEILGVGKRDIYMELSKVLRQDSDIGAKLKAADILAKMGGFVGEEKGNIEIKIAQGIKLAD